MMQATNPQPLSIAALGTSLTARGTWVEALPAALGAHIHRPVRAVNFGRSGATSREALGMIEEVTQSRPDIVIIEFATNDSALHRRISLRESAANLEAILRRLRAANASVRPYLMTMSPAIGPRAFLRSRLARYYDLYSTLATRHGAGYIDNRPDWDAMPRTALRRALPDGTHPTAEFARRITLTNVVSALARDDRARAP
jgi:acyl-CoA thioesterase I